MPPSSLERRVVNTCLSECKSSVHFSLLLLSTEEQESLRRFVMLPDRLQCSASDSMLNASRSHSAMVFPTEFSSSFQQVALQRIQTAPVAQDVPSHHWEEKPCEWSPVYQSM